MKRLIKIFWKPILILGTSILLSGCFAELAVMEEIGLDELALTAEDATLLEEGSAAINAGRIVATDEAAFTSQLSKIRLSRIAGENPRLFVEGRAGPLGEVIADEGKIRLFDYNKKFSISDNIFSVEGEKINVRATASTLSDNNIITTLNKGNLVVILAEDEGWYQIKVAQGSKVYFGFIKASLLAPVIHIKNDNKWNSNTISHLIRSYKGRPINQYNEYLQTTLHSFEVIDDKINIVLEFTNISKKRWLGVALKANGSDGMADYWKFLPQARGKITDNKGNEYGISDVSGLGFAKTSDDWTILEYGKSFYATLSLSNNQIVFSGDNYSLSLEIWLAYRDLKRIEQKRPVVIYMSNIKPT